MEMKKNLSIFAAFLMAAALLVSFASCDDGSETKKVPAVTSVRIGDANGNPLIGPIEEGIGTTVQFSAIVKVTNGAPKTVTWEVASDQSDGPVAGTGINDSGLLTINADESDGTTLTVTATSTMDASKSASIQVTLVKMETYSVAIEIRAGDEDKGNVTASAASATKGTLITLTIEPAEGYELDTITATSGGEPFSLNGSGNTRTFEMPAADVNVTVTWKVIDTPILPGTYTVNIIVDPIGSGTVTANPTEAKEGDTITLTPTPGSGYALPVVYTITKAGGGTVTPTGNTFEMPADNVTVTAVFAIIPAEPNAIVIDSLTNGTIAASINGVEVTTGVEGETVTLTIAPGSGYTLKVSSLEANDGDVPLSTEKLNIWTFEMPGEPVTVTAEFVEFMIIEDFSDYIFGDAGLDSPENKANGYASYSWWTGVPSENDEWRYGDGNVCYFVYGEQWHNFNRKQLSIDLSEYDRITFWARQQSGGPSAIFFKFNDDGAHQIAFTATDTWTQISISKEDINYTDVFAAMTAWVFLYNNDNAGNLLIESILAEKD